MTTDPLIATSPTWKLKWLEYRDGHALKLSPNTSRFHQDSVITTPPKSVHTQTDMHAHIHNPHKHTDTDTHTDTQTHRQTHIQTYTQTLRLHLLTMQLILYLIIYSH